MEEHKLKQSSDKLSVQQRGGGGTTGEIPTLLMKLPTGIIKMVFVSIILNMIPLSLLKTRQWLPLFK